MQLYSQFPIVTGKTERADELQSSFASQITLICAQVSGVEVPPHERPLSIKATLSGEEVFAFGQHARATHARKGSTGAGKP